MSDTTEPRKEAAASAEPLNDSTEMRDAIRSIEAIGEDRTGSEHADSAGADRARTPLDEADEADAETGDRANPDIDLDEDGS